MLSSTLNQATPPRLAGLVLAALLFATGAPAQESETPAAPPTPPPAPCQNEAFRQFDFWIGEWTVTTPANPARPPAKNRISAIDGGCAILEQYETPGGYTGTSISFYNPRAEAWHQTWIDNQGQPVFQDGGIKDGSMVMHEDRGGGITTRTTWTPNADGTVRQHWEQSNDDGKTWRTIFDGLYTKTGS